MMFDTTELQHILEKLENLDDEELAVELLAEFNEKKKSLGNLIMNRDPSLSHEEWKKQCDEAKIELDKVLRRIEHA